MPRSRHHARDLKVWRIQGLRDLELRRAEGDAISHAPHLHSEFEIMVVERGAQRVRIGGTTHVAEAGAVVVIPPGDVHANERATPNAAYRSFFPDLSSLIDASATTGGGGSMIPRFRAPVIHDIDLAFKIGALHRMLERPGSFLARETHAVLSATTLVSRHGTWSPNIGRLRNENVRVRAVVERLHDRLDGNVSLTELCALTNLPAHTLVRAFAKRVGMPPHSYHVHLRINRAKSLLARGHAPARVAADTGFVDQSHLTRHFRRVVGVGPGAYAAAVIP